MEILFCLQLHLDTEKESIGWDHKVDILIFLILMTRSLSTLNFSNKILKFQAFLISACKDHSVVHQFQWCTDFSNRNFLNLKNYQNKLLTLQMDRNKSWKDAFQKIQPKFTKTFSVFLWKFTKQLLVIILPNTCALVDSF